MVGAEGAGELQSLGELVDHDHGAGAHLPRHRHRLDAQTAGALDDHALTERETGPRESEEHLGEGAVHRGHERIGQIVRYPEYGAARPHVVVLRERPDPVRELARPRGAADLRGTRGSLAVEAHVAAAAGIEVAVGHAVTLAKRLPERVGLDAGPERRHAPGHLVAEDPAVGRQRERRVPAPEVEVRAADVREGHADQDGARLERGERELAELEGLARPQEHGGLAGASHRGATSSREDWRSAAMLARGLRRGRGAGPACAGPRAGEIQVPRVARPSSASWRAGRGNRALRPLVPRPHSCRRCRPAARRAILAAGAAAAGPRPAPEEEATVGYVERHLLPNERVIYKTKLHWVLFAKPALVTLLGARPHCGPWRPVRVEWLWYLSLLVIVAGLVWGAIHAVELLTSEFAVTTTRLIFKVGLDRPLHDGAAPGQGGVHRRSADARRAPAELRRPGGDGDGRRARGVPACPRSDRLPEPRAAGFASGARAGARSG